MDLFDSPWKVLIIAVVFIVFFGARKLPDAARSLGKSMRILKAEVQDLHGEDAEADKGKATAALPTQSAPPAVPPTQQQIDQLQQQIRDLQTQPAAGQAATVNGAPAPETTQRTQQAG